MRNKMEFLKNNLKSVQIVKIFNLVYLKNSDFMIVLCARSSYVLGFRVNGLGIAYEGAEHTLT